MSNFGLTFRNSKWSDYAIKNVTLNSRVSFFRLIFNAFMIIVMITLAISITYYYNPQLQFNELTYQFWSFFDETLYLIGFLLWVISYSFVFVSKIIHDKIFNFFYQTSNISDSQKINTSSIPLTNVKYKPSQHMYSPLFLSWLNTTTTNELTSSSIEELAKSNTELHNWNIYQQVFKTLYLASYNLSNINNTININNINSKDVYTINNFVNQFNTSLLVDELKPNTPNNYFVTDSNNIWNLNTFSSELNKYNNLVLAKTGSFYLNDLSFNKINQLVTSSPELASLTSSMLNQTKVIKWNRWLYRYNVLHRKTVKNSHKLTMVKKLITTGFYDSSLTSNNIWASDFFSKNNQSTGLIHSQFNTLYKNTFNNNNKDSTVFNSISLNSMTTPINMLQFYEKSYFWFIKRFYLFNTLDTNNISSDVIKSKPTLITSTVDQKQQSSTLFNLILNGMLRSNSLTNSSLNPTYLNTYISSLKKPNQLNVSNDKDVSILITELDLLNTDNLELLLNLNNNITSLNNNVSFFNLNNYHNDYLTNTHLVLNLQKHPKKHNLNSHYTHIDNKLLIDLYLLSTTNTSN